MSLKKIYFEAELARGSSDSYKRFTYIEEREQKYSCKFSLVDTLREET